MVDEATSKLVQAKEELLRVNRGLVSQVDEREKRLQRYRTVMLTRLNKPEDTG